MTINVNKIDSEVPVPVRLGLNIPLEKLEVGESILFPVELRSNVQSKASRVKKATGMNFTIKKLSDKSARIWRIA